MTKKRSAKRALIASILMLCFCFSMLAGTTFAWFTDSVTSTGNIIQSGTLDVSMEWKDATATGAQQTYKDASLGAIFNYDNWEPGYVDAKNIKIANDGTLAFKYQLNIIAAGKQSKLTDVIDVYYAEGEFTLADRSMSELTKIGTLTEVLAQYNTTASGDLLRGETDTITIALKMQEQAGNEYQNLSIGTEFSVQLIATQLASESDSFDTNYDIEAAYLNKDAEGAWLINNIDELYYFSSQVNSGNSYLGETVKLTADIDLAGYNWVPIGAGDVEGVWVGFNGIFDGQNHTISNVTITKSGGWNGIFGLVGRGTSKFEESISNLNVKNMVIEETNRMTGGIVGQLYGNIENCHVENVTVKAIPNKTDKGEYDNGDKIGGVVGWFGDNGNNHYIRNCSAKNVTLTAYRDVAGIVGYIGTTSTVENCSVDTVTIVIDQETNHYGDKDANAGGVVGRIYNDPVTIQNNTENNVKIYTTTTVSNFADLKDAFTKGKVVVKVEEDIVFDEPIVMENGEDVILDMNGKTITPIGTKADPFFDTYPGTSLVITGNGTFNLGNNPSMSILMPGGDVTIKNGRFLKDRLDKVNGPLIAAYGQAQGKFIIEGGYFDSGYYIEGDCFNNCRNGVNLTNGNVYRIYGGTFVGQNPAWGDEGRAVLCPHCNNDGSNCQGVMLEGQTSKSTELPAGYTIIEGVTADGRPTYTVIYSK